MLKSGDPNFERQQRFLRSRTLTCIVCPGFLFLLLIIGPMYLVGVGKRSDYWDKMILYRSTVYTLENRTTETALCTPQSHEENCFVGVLVLRPQVLPNRTCSVPIPESLNRDRDEADFYVREHFSVSVPIVGSYTVTPGTEELDTCTRVIIRPPKQDVSVIAVYIFLGIVGVLLVAQFISGLLACCVRDRRKPFTVDECCSYFVSIPP